MSNMNIGSIASSSMLNYRQQSALSTKSATANALFGSLNIDESNIAASISLSDYGQIKSGSYGKLLTSYYKKLESETKVSSTKTDTTDEASKTKKTSYENNSSNILESVLSTYKPDGTANKNNTGSNLDTTV